MGMDCLGALCDKSCNNSCVDVCEVGNGREISGSLSEPMIGDLSGIVTEGFTIPKNSVHKIIFVK